MKKLCKIGARLLLVILAAAFFSAGAMKALGGGKPKQLAETPVKEVSASGSEVVKYDVEITGEKHKMRGNGVSAP